MWSAAPVPPWPGILVVTLVLVLMVWVLATLRRLAVLGRRAVLAVGFAVVGALVAGLLITASTAAEQALGCEQKRAGDVTGAVTGLGLGCVRFLYRPDLADSVSLPTGPVVLIEEVGATRWVRDPATGVLHGVPDEAILVTEIMRPQR